MKTIIAPAYLHEYLKIEKLKENNSNYLLDHRFLDPDTFIREIIGQDNDSLLSVNTVFNITDLEIFRDVIKYPAFKKKVFNFYRFLKKNNIDLTGLPEDNPTKKELKKILSALSVADINENNYQSLYETMEQTDFSEYEIYQSFTDIDDKRMYDLFYKNKATRKNILNTKGETKVYKCLNMHQEAEAVAQDIINKNLDIAEVNIILCSKEYNKVMKQVLDLYRIPFGMIEDTKINHCNRKFISLLKLYLDNSIENYTAAVAENAFNVSGNQEFDYYVNNFVADFEECKSEFKYFSQLESSLGSRNLNTLVKMEENANIIQQLIIEDLTALLNATDLKEALVVIFNILKSNNDISELKKLKKEIEDSVDYMNLDNIELFISMIRTESTYSTSFTDKVAVTSLLKPVPARKTSYILGCDQKSYPAFKIASGYFDQDYLDDIGYFTQSEQYNFHLEQIHWIYKSAENINFFSSIAGYDGKAKSMAFEIENLGDSEFVNIISKNHIQNEKHELSEENARKAFIKDNNIYGSVSSFEKYFSCPYAYFLNYGLKLYPQQIIDLAPNTIGTATHAIFENMVRNNPKAYAEADIETINKVTDDYFMELKKIFRNRIREIDSIQHRLVNTIYKAFEFYKSMEENTLFKAEYFEKEVRSSYTRGNLTLNIKGYIDRIDLYSDGFRIIDYKSGHQTLTDDRLLKGEKLQLATYTNIISKETGLVPYGSYYAFFKAKKIDVPAYTFSITKKSDIFDAQKKHDEFIKQFKMTGFTYQYDDNCDNSEHISGITAKNKIRGKAIIYEQVQEALEDIYTYLMEKLSSGNIELKPVEGACTYCEYLPICRFKGIHIKYPPKISEVNLKSTGDEE